MVSSPGFVSNMRHSFALFRLGFPAPTADTALSSPRTLTRWLILLKARRQGRLQPLRPVVSTQFQILFHSPRRGSFHLSLTVLMRYRSSRVFSLGWWTTQLRTTLAWIVLLRILAAAFSYAYGTLTPYGRPSQILRLKVSAACASPATPYAVTHGLGYSAFARHYSQNPLLSSSYLDVSVRTVPLPTIAGMTALERRQVSPFGHLRLSRSYTPHRRLSQYNASFIGTRRLGIHCAPLLAFRTHRTESPALLARDNRYYLRVDYSTVKTHRAARADGPVTIISQSIRSVHQCQGSIEKPSEPPSQT